MSHIFAKKINAKILRLNKCSKFFKNELNYASSLCTYNLFTWIILRLFLYILEEDELTEKIEDVIGVLKDLDDIEDANGVLKDPDDDIEDVNGVLKDPDDDIEVATEESDEIDSSDELGEIEADKAEVVEDDDGKLEDKEGSK